MFKITIDSRQLRASLCTAGNKDLRYYLNGVCIEATTTYTRLISTSGSCMSVQISNFDNEVPGEGVNTFIIPRDIASLVTAKSGPTVDLLSADGVIWQIKIGPSSVAFNMIDGNFPDWRRVIQNTNEIINKVSDYDIDLLQNFSKAANILGFKHPGANVKIEQNGTDGGRIVLTGRGDYLGVIMPMRPKAPGEIAIIDPLLIA